MLIALPHPFREGRPALLSTFQAIGGAMFLALCPQVVPQAPQHFRSFETGDSCFACQSIFHAISFLLQRAQDSLST